MAVTVNGLYIYPIKSCGGIALKEAEIEAKGFAHDRRYLIINQENMFVTQREIARVALIRTGLEADALIVTAPEMGTQRIPFDRSGERRAVTIWKNSGVGAIDQGDEIAEWLSDFLKSSVRLVRFAEDAVRRIDPKYAPRESDEVGFADAYPFLMISEESLEDLNNRLDEPLPMNRFRPNIVVRGGGAFAEDTWRCVEINDIIFEGVKRCARCVITTTDQNTAWRSKEPLKTLATYRDSERGVLFGQNMTHQQNGTICVGDVVQIKEIGAIP